MKPNSKYPAFKQKSLDIQRRKRWPRWGRRGGNKSIDSYIEKMEFTDDIKIAIINMHKMLRYKRKCKDNE